MFVLGKNFLKDTKVFFQQYDGGQVVWESGVTPDKEYLQQVMSHNQFQNELTLTDRIFNFRHISCA